MVLLAGGRAERGENGVTDELLERSASRLDLLGGSVVVALEQRARSLRILLAELGRSDQVDEENRRQFPLGNRGRCRRRYDLRTPRHELDRRRRKVEVRLVTQDGLLEIAQRAARLEPELVDECAPRLLIDRQRDGLPPSPVEGEHQ